MKKLLVCKLFILLISTMYSAVSHDFGNFIFPHDFNSAMISDSRDKKAYRIFLQKTPHKKLLNTIKRKYEAFVQQIEDLVAEEPIIPKIIHQIWIGPHPFPTRAKAWRDSWLALHPDWEYILWTNKEVEELEFKNKRYYNQASNWGEKADILRYEILYRYGGVYVDVDFACNKPLDILHYTCDFYAGIHAIPLLFKNRLRINNGLIAARPQHPILANAVNQIKHFRNKQEVAHRTGPDFFTTVIQKYFVANEFHDNVDIVFPSNFFYPSGKKTGIGFTIKPGCAFIQPETLAVHYYTAFWLRPPGKNGRKWRQRSRRLRDKKLIRAKRKNLVYSHKKKQKNGKS